MASEPVSGGIVLAGAASAAIVAGDTMALNLPLSDFGWATVFAMIGVLGRVTMDAKAARDEAASKGVAQKDLPTIDLTSLVYAAFGAPLIGGVALGVVRWTNFVPDYTAAFVIMGIGYGGRSATNTIIGITRSLVNKKFDA